MEKVIDSVPKAVSTLLKYEELKKKMNDDIDLLFSKLEKIDRDKTTLMTTIIDSLGNLSKDTHDTVMKITTEANNIINEFIKEHHEEYDVLKGYNYDKDTKQLVTVAEIEQKHTGVGLHSIIIEYGKTPSDFVITHKKYV